MKPPNKMHWIIAGMSDKRAFCGRAVKAESKTEDKDKVTCDACILQMKLHDHLPKVESEYAEAS